MVGRAFAVRAALCGLSLCVAAASSGSQLGPRPNPWPPARPRVSTTTQSRATARGRACHGHAGRAAPPRPVQPSRNPPLCIYFTRAGIEWRRCHHAIYMEQPCKVCQRASPQSRTRPSPDLAVWLNNAGPSTSSTPRITEPTPRAPRTPPPCCSTVSSCSGTALGPAAAAHVPVLAAAPAAAPSWTWVALRSTWPAASSSSPAPWCSQPREPETSRSEVAPCEPPGPSPSPGSCSS